MKGAFTSFASLLAISVFPTPVGPINIIFLGATSSFNSSGKCLLLYLFLKAMATDLLASVCPIIYWSKASTIFLGVSSLSNFASNDIIL